MRKSKLWVQSYETFMKNPYDYESDEEFLEEALAMLNIVFEYFGKFQLKYEVDERTVEKAIWMLHLDALDTLRDCLGLLKQRRHRIVGKMFRDIVETLDLAALFWGERDSGSPHLKEWYENKTIGHVEFRKHLGKTKKYFQTDIPDPSFEDYSKKMYSGLSKWTHHCYPSLMNSYSVAGKNGKMLVYESRPKAQILPRVISEYTWELKDTLLYFLSNVKTVGLVDWNKLAGRINKIVKGLQFT